MMLMAEYEQIDVEFLGALQMTAGRSCSVALTISPWASTPATLSLSTSCCTTRRSTSSTSSSAVQTPSREPAVMSSGTMWPRATCST